MRTVLTFNYKGRAVAIRKAAGLGPQGPTTHYSIQLDNDVLPGAWPHTPEELAAAMRALIDDETSNSIHAHEKND